MENIVNTFFIFDAAGVRKDLNYYPARGWI